MDAIIYLLQVSACTAIFYLFYYLLLSKLTFFAINRWYLLFSVMLSFIVPALSITVNPEQQQIPIIQQAVYVNKLQSEPADLTYIQNTNLSTAVKPFIDWILLLKVLYCTAVIALTFHLGITLFFFLRKIKGRQAVKVGRVNILQGDKSLTNGSFFNYIFLNNQELSLDEQQQIIAHEMLHVKLLHSVDRIIVKVAQIVLWFNPIIYLFSKAIEENHEFEVDRAMVNSTDKKLYANLLLHLSVAGQGLLYHNFSKIPLKKRITMLFNQPSAKMKKVIYVLILPVVLISCLAFARLKNAQADKKYSVIDGVEKLGKDPLVLINGKVYEKDILYKIGNFCIKSIGIWNPNPTIKKHGVLIKDGFVEITTKNGKISYMSSVERENLIKVKAVPKDQFYSRLKLQNENGRYFDRIIVQLPDSYYLKEDVSVGGKAFFSIDGKPYTEEQFKKIPDSYISRLIFKAVGSSKKHDYSNPYEAFFFFTTTKGADTTKYRQKIKRSPEQIKGKEKFDAYRQTDDFKQKEKLSKDVMGKTITVRIKGIVNRDARKNSDMFISNKGKVRGFLVVYNGNEYFMPTKYGQEKQLNSLLKIGDEITLKVFGSTFGKDTQIIIQPAFVIKNGLKIFQLAEADKIPSYPFLYEANKVRFADGQITHIEKYANGKWKSAVLEIVNGYKFTLNFKPTDPAFANIEESDHVRLRFVHEIKTGAKTYQINDWVSITNNVKDYGVKNPEFFYKFYETVKSSNQDKSEIFKVTNLSYNVTDNHLLAILKNNQDSSLISKGKLVNINTFREEKNRIYKLLSPAQLQLKMKDIVFNVDTTMQKGSCTVVTVVRSEI